MRGGGSFSMEELQMLRDLPAVANVSKDRITYSNAFKQVCVIRYLAGESPTKIFREAGLPPELIRLSIGIEHIDDILEDLDQALGEI